MLYNAYNCKTEDQTLKTKFKVKAQILAESTSRLKPAG